MAMLAHGSVWVQHESWQVGALRRRRWNHDSGGQVRTKNVGLIVAGLVVATLSGCRSSSQITQRELERRTQELFDAVAPGDQTPWKKYYAEDSMYFDEKGRPGADACGNLRKHQNRKGAKPHRRRRRDPELRHEGKGNHLRSGNDRPVSRDGHLDATQRGMANHCGASASLLRRSRAGNRRYESVRRLRWNVRTGSWKHANDF